MSVEVLLKCCNLVQSHWFEGHNEAQYRHKKKRWREEAFSLLVSGLCRVVLCCEGRCLVWRHGQVWTHLFGSNLVMQELNSALILLYSLVECLQNAGRLGIWVSCWNLPKNEKLKTIKRNLFQGETEAFNTVCIFGQFCVCFTDVILSPDKLGTLYVVFPISLYDPVLALLRRTGKGLQWARGLKHKITELCR